MEVPQRYVVRTLSISIHSYDVLAIQGRQNADRHNGRHLETGIARHTYNATQDSWSYAENFVSYWHYCS